LTEKQRKILKAIFANPVRANVAWSDVESLLRGLGATITEGRGSRVRVVLNGVAAVFHRPHPQKEVSKAAVRALRDYLREADIDETPDPGQNGGI
jgi:hypothetical protein